MSDAFDPYYRWLGIPPKDQPPDHYRLLSVERFEAHADVIAEAADRQMAHLRTRQSGQHANLAAKLLNEISAARVCLLSSSRKAAYDAQLAKSLERQSQTADKSRWGLMAAAVGFCLFASILLIVVWNGGDDGDSTNGLADAGDQKKVASQANGARRTDLPEPADGSANDADDAAGSTSLPDAARAKTDTSKQIATGVWRPIENGAGRVKTIPPDSVQTAEPDTNSKISSSDASKPAVPSEIEVPSTSTADVASIPDHAIVPDSVESQPAEPVASKLTSPADALTAGREVAQFPLGKYPLTSFAMCADGQRIVTCNSKNQLAVIDLKAGKEIQTLPGADLEIEHLAMVPDGRFFMATGFTEGNLAQLRTYRVDDAEELTTLASANGPVTALAISLDNNGFASGHRLGLVSLNSTKATVPPVLLYARQRTAEITSLVFSSDNQHLVFGDRTGEVHVALIGARKPNVQQRIEAHGAAIQALGVSSRGDLLMTAAADGSIALWFDWRGRDTAKPKLKFSTSALGPSCAALSPSGNLIASASETGAITLWDATTGKAVAALTGHTGTIIGLAFLPDGARLASASRDGTVRIWNCSIK